MLLSRVTQKMVGNKVWNIVLTGGPCAGKTTGVEIIRKRLTENGIGLMVVPEIATLLFGAGVPRGIVASGTMDERIELQRRIMKIQIEIESSMINLAKTLNKPTVILCDRGVMDGKAFYNKQIWSTILSLEAWTDESLLNRYCGIVHLVTAADGAESFYSASNNATRLETPEQAVQQDRQLQLVYESHPNKFIIKNDGGFDLKMKHCADSIMKLVDIQQSKL